MFEAVSTYCKYISTNVGLHCDAYEIKMSQELTNVNCMSFHICKPHNNLLQINNSMPHYLLIIIFAAKVVVSFYGGTGAF